MSKAAFRADFVGSFLRPEALKDGSGTIRQRFDYYPFGTVSRVYTSSSSTDYSLKRYRFGGKEIAGSALTELGGTGAAPAAPYLDFGARLYSPRTATWLSVDPLAEKYYGIGPLTYCAGNPVNLVDPTGLAWIPRINQSTGEMEGFDWLEDTDIALDNGELPDGVYHQALFFTDSGDFNAGSKKNIGTSIAVAYLADGSIRLFDACTYPSDLIRYPTIPEGGYEASVGTHKGSYIALKMYDIGKGLSDNTIELGFQNPAYTDGRTYAMGVDIHKAGFNNSTGMTSDRKPISAACFLIDINRWDDFINLFNTDSQRNNKVGVMVSRHRAAPIIPNY